MTATLKNLTIPRGKAWTQAFPALVDNGSTVWFAGRAYALNAVVSPSPTNLAPYPTTGLLYLATNAGTAAATQPAWPTVNGGTVVDNPGGSQITWQAQVGSAYPMSMTGVFPAMPFRTAPDDPNAPIVSLAVSAGLVLATGLITASLTIAQIEALLAVGTYGSYALDTVTGGVTAPLYFGAWQIVPSANHP